jgi:hypothetical protein
MLLDVFSSDFVAVLCSNQGLSQLSSQSDHRVQLVITDCHSIETPDGLSPEEEIYSPRTLTKVSRALSDCGCQ